jgi:hypothetical protein
MSFLGAFATDSCFSRGPFFVYSTVLRVFTDFHESCIYRRRPNVSYEPRLARKLYLAYNEA